MFIRIFDINIIILSVHSLPRGKERTKKARQGSPLGTPPPRRFNAPAVGITIKNQRADIPEGRSALWVGSSPNEKTKGDHYGQHGLN